MVMKIFSSLFLIKCKLDLKITLTATLHVAFHYPTHQNVLNPSFLSRLPSFAQRF